MNDDELQALIEVHVSQLLTDLHYAAPEMWAFMIRRRMGELAERIANQDRDAESADAP